MASSVPAVSSVNSANDSLAELNISDVKQQGEPDKSDPTYKEWQLNLEPLYKLCMKYYKGGCVF